MLISTILITKSTIFYCQTSTNAVVVIIVAQLMPTVRIRSVHMNASVLMDSLGTDLIVLVNVVVLHIYHPVTGQCQPLAFG